MTSVEASDSNESRIADLITGNHILANEHVLDGFGHISVRSATDPRHFFMARSRADVLPFTVTNAPFKALIHVAAFLGNSPAPVFEIRDAVGDDNRMLVNENRSGAALAALLGNRAVVLMRGHGMSVVGPNAREVVLRAIYTQLNARIETVALRMGEPTFLNEFEVQRTDPIDRPWEAWAAKA
jgi:Class II Aldolase and Adducin N-terminal domain